VQPSVKVAVAYVIGVVQVNPTVSQSMNNWVGDYDPTTGGSSVSADKFKIIRKISDMTDATPSGTFVLLDERADSINDADFFTNMKGFDPPNPAKQ
jgi:hypothetical protein